VLSIILLASITLKRKIWKYWPGKGITIGGNVLLPAIWKEKYYITMMWSMKVWSG
jgi:hypothetical protein